MEEYVNDTTEAIAEKWALSNVYALGHISDGNIHFFVQPNVESDSSSLHESCDALLYEGLKHNNGSISAEHGIGIEKKQWLSQSRSETEVNLIRAMKNMLGPRNLLNPGRISD